MALFERRQKKERDLSELADRAEQEQVVDAHEERVGPLDSEGHGPPQGYVDLGSLYVPPVPGMQVRALFEADGKTLHRIQLILGTSGIRISVAAAPRSGGVWDELRGQLMESVEKQGGSHQEVEGRYGMEILARLPVELPNGARGFTPTRFIGVEGPRWVVRLDVQGAAAAGDPEQVAICDAVIDRLIVNRGGEPRVRLSLLPLQLPKDVSPAGESS